MTRWPGTDSGSAYRYGSTTARFLVARTTDRACRIYESLENRVARLELKVDADLEFDFHLIRVPLGQQSWKTTYLQFFYKRELLNFIPKSPRDLIRKLLERSDYQFTVSPNHLPTLANPPPLWLLFAPAAFISVIVIRYTDN